MVKRLAFLLPLALIMSLVGSSALGVTLDIRITDPLDDHEEHLSDGRMDVGSTDLELAYEDAGNPATDEQWVGVRFVAAIPKGAKVTHAYVEFEVDAVNKNGSTNPVNLVIEGQLTPNAPAITNTAKDLTGRGPWTTAKAKWSVPPWTATNVHFPTSDLSAVLQEIIDQDGWASGNALLLIVRDDKDNPSTGIREAESREGEAGAAPLLHVEFTPVEASEPAPADGAADMADVVSLSWTAGYTAVQHDVFFGTDQAAVAAGDAQALQGRLAQTTFVPAAPLAWNTTYYWRVDEIDAAGKAIPGAVWSFTVADFLVIDLAGQKLSYDNSVAPNLSQLTWDVAKDWTANGISDLMLQFKGQAPTQGSVSYDAATGTYTVVGAGTDIWGTADQFTYAYKTLTGDGTMIARVTSIGPGTNTWAKAGVMIRQSLAAGSTHASMDLSANTDGTAGNGYSFQRRLAADGTSTGDNGVVPAIAPPYWVKIERKGDVFSGSISADGQTWTVFGTPQTIVMTDPVLIGLCATSHAAGQERTMTFDSLSTTGNAVPEGPLVTWDIIDPTRNDAQPIYAALEDGAGKVVSVAYDDPAATLVNQPWTWKIPLASFAGVDLKNVAKLHLGVGDLLNPAPGGSGVVTFSNIRVVKPVILAKGDDVTAPGDNVIGVPNDGVAPSGNTAGWPANEAPWFALDNNVKTKFLHFKGKVEPTGFRVQPLVGPTVVTGITFTTANDSEERDPLFFELSGSNDSIEGPYTLITSGMIVEFLVAPLRLTKTVMPITFANTVAYKYYQVMFPIVRDPGKANSMQIAEVELLNGGAHVMWVSDAYDDSKDGIRDDQPWIDLLTSQGYTVEYRMGPAFGNGYWRTLDQAKIDALNAADLIISSRNFNSGDYNNGNERNQWNGVTTPLICMSMHVVRSSHWKWFNTTTIPTAIPLMQPVDPSHAAFAGVTLDEKGQIAALDPRNCSFPGTKTAGNGTVIATRADTGDVWIAQWAAGTEFYAGSGQIPAGPRVFFAAGTQEVAATATAAAIGRGDCNLTDSGKVVFLNVMDMLLK